MQGLRREKLKALYMKGFPDDTESYTDFFFDSYIKDENIISYEEDGEIISAGYIVEKPAVIFGKRTVFPYFTALSTLPEHRGKGRIGIVMEKAFSVLRSRGYAYFGLHPFDYNYYKRFGLENISYACHSTITGGNNFEVRDYSPDDFETVKRIYDFMSGNANSRLLLTKDVFAYKVGEYAADGISCKLLYDCGECFAFAFADKGNVDYYATTNKEKFMCAECFKGCSFYDFSLSVSPYLQGRIVDAKSALKEYFSAYPHKDIISFRISDNIISENNICVAVDCTGGKTEIYDCEDAENELDISELTGKIFFGKVNFFPDKY